MNFLIGNQSDGVLKTRPYVVLGPVRVVIFDNRFRCLILVNQFQYTCTIMRVPATQGLPK